MYTSLRECVNDLEKHGDLIRINTPVSADQEIALIQRLAFRKKAPAMLFTNVQGCAFPMLANLFGTKERIHFIFRKTLPTLKFLFEVKADPSIALKKPWKALPLIAPLWHTLAKKVKNGPVLQCQGKVSDLPQLKSWPMDGGAFITLPLVYSENPKKTGIMQSNLGMYRVQLSGNDYIQDKEVGLHYQIHRGIGAHHMAALDKGTPLPVRIFIGGPPAMTLAAVMPLPENLSEILFAGALGGKRIAMIAGEHVNDNNSLPLWAQADFCISGYIMPQCKPEGPFGDHLGYYSLAHPFPVLKVQSVFHRQDAIWPFTSVGRPPQEDTLFGDFIHELTGPLVPQVFSGVHEVHAVDAAGVHPLLLTIGSERYTPFAEERRPQELLTCACNVLGTTQTALAKYCFITAKEDNPSLTTHDIPAYFTHVLERTHLDRDLHFITNTTTDTLDYTGTGLNAGSKLIWAVAGKPCRTLGRELPSNIPLPQGFNNIKLFSPGILIVSGTKDTRTQEHRGNTDPYMEELATALQSLPQKEKFPLVVVVDDSNFTCQSWDNFLWVVFTRSDPAIDIYGTHAQFINKHWSCQAPLIIDARLKGYQAPPLEVDKEVLQRVQALGIQGAPLHPYI